MVGRDRCAICSCLPLFLIVRVCPPGDRTRSGVQVLLHALPPPDDAFPGILAAFLVFGALGAERVLQHVIAFVALVRQHYISRRRGERPREYTMGDINPPTP